MVLQVLRMIDYLSSIAIVAEIATIQIRWPGAQLSCFTHPFEGLCVRLEFSVPNAYACDGVVQDQGVNIPVPPIVSVEHLHDWLQWRLGIMALHELNEFYWVNGSPRFDPHRKEYWKLRA
jgi:hypothetical protein